MSSRAARPETQRLVPSAAALRPSRVVANFQVTKGRPCSTAKVHTRLTARASSTISPCSTSTPPSRSSAAPPAATGLGSAWANTTRRTPASRRAIAHGPVRPVWAHGSRVTTAVVPRARCPACTRASASACRLPAPRWYPSATVAPASSSSTQPTRGLGPSGTPGVTASARARVIAACSAAVKPISMPLVSGLTDSGAGRRTRTRLQQLEPAATPACASHPDF